MDKLQLLQEADRRGLLPPDKKAMFAEAIQRGLINQPETPTVPTEPRTLPQEAGRQAGLGLRAVGTVAAGAVAGAGAGALIGGIGAIPGAAAGAGAMSLTQLVDNLAGTHGVDWVLDKLGLPKPETPTERVAGDVAGAVAGQSGMVGLGKSMAQSSGPTVSRIGEMLASKPGLQAGAAAAGSATGSSLKETGASYPVQLTGNVLASLIAAPVAAKALHVGYRGLVEPWLKPEAIKGRAYLDAAGEQADNIGSLLRTPKQIVPGSLPTAGEAAVPAGRAEFSALQRSAEKVKPSDYLARSDSQNAARLAQVRTVGKTPEALKAAEAARKVTADVNYGAVANDRINPKSDLAIMEEAIAGREASKGEALRDWGRFTTAEAQQKSLAHGETISKTAGGRDIPSPSARPVVGLPRIYDRYTENFDRIPEANKAAAEAMGIAAYRQQQADFLENALESLKNTVGVDSRGLGGFLNKPSMKEAVHDALLSAQESGAYFPASKGEQFSVANLQRIKESLDSGIAASKASVNAGKRPELSPKELEGTRQEFISWLSNKSPGWKKARLEFADASKPINQMQVGQYLEGKLVPALSEEAKQKSAAYAGALADAPGTIKRSTGGPRFEELTKILTPAQMDAVNSVRDDLARGARFDEMATKGSKAAPNAIDLASQSMEKEVGGKLPNLLHRGAMVMNAIIGRLEGKVNRKLAAEMATEMLNPPAVGESLAKASARATANKVLAEDVVKFKAAYLGGSARVSNEPTKE